MSRTPTSEPSEEPTGEFAFFAPAADSTSTGAIAPMQVEDSSQLPPLDLGDVTGDPLDEDFAPHPRRRASKLTVLLAVVLVAGLGVLGGIQLQKHQSSGTASASAFGARGAAALRSGAAGRGGFGGEGFAGGGFGGAGGSQSGTTGGTGTTGTTATPVVIGTVVSVATDSVVIQNLGGKQVTAKTTSATTVTKSLGTADLKAGQSVSVYGTAAADGSVTATNITIRQP